MCMFSQVKYAFWKILMLAMLPRLYYSTGSYLRGVNLTDGSDTILVEAYIKLGLRGYKFHRVQTVELHVSSQADTQAHKHTSTQAHATASICSQLLALACVLLGRTLLEHRNS